MQTDQAWGEIQATKFLHVQTAITVRMESVTSRIREKDKTEEAAAGSGFARRMPQEKEEGTSMIRGRAVAV